MTFHVCLGPSSTTSWILEDQCAHSVSQLNTALLVDERLNFQTLQTISFSWQSQCLTHLVTVNNWETRFSCIKNFHCLFPWYCAYYSEANPLTITLHFVHVRLLLFLSYNCKGCVGFAAFHLRSQAKHCCYFLLLEIVDLHFLLGSSQELLEVSIEIRHTDVNWAVAFPPHMGAVDVRCWFLELPEQCKSLWEKAGWL